MVLKYLLCFSKYLYCVLTMNMYFLPYVYLLFSLKKKKSKKKIIAVNLHVMLKPHLVHTD